MAFDHNSLVTHSIRLWICRLAVSKQRDKVKIKEIGLLRCVVSTPNGTILFSFMSVGLWWAKHDVKMYNPNCIFQHPAELTYSEGLSNTFNGNVFIPEQIFPIPKQRKLSETICCVSTRKKVQDYSLLVCLVKVWQLFGVCLHHFNPWWTF